MELRGGQQCRRQHDRIFGLIPRSGGTNTVGSLSGSQQYDYLGYQASNSHPRWRFSDQGTLGYDQEVAFPSEFRTRLFPSWSLAIDNRAAYACFGTPLPALYSQAFPIDAALAPLYTLHF